MPIIVAIVSTITARLAEPSTWAGLAAIFSSVNGALAHQVSLQNAAIGVLMGAVAVLKSEAGSKKQ